MDTKLFDVSGKEIRTKRIFDASGKEIRTKRLGTGGIGKAINFSPTLLQRECFDKLLARTGATQAKIARDALTMYLESKGFSKADQGIEE